MRNIGQRPARYRMPTGNVSDRYKDPRQKLADAMTAAGLQTGPVQSWTQGLARMANAAAGAYANSQIQGDKNAANEAAATGMNAVPWTNPDQPDAGVAPGTEGGYTGATRELGKLDGNRYAGRLSRDMAQQQFMRGQALSDRAEQREYQQGLLAAKNERTDNLAARARVNEAGKGNIAFDRQMELERLKGKTSQLPMTVKEWNFYNTLPEPQKEQFLQMKRASQKLNLGDQVVIPSQVNPAQPSATYPKGVPPQNTPEFKERQAAATAAGTAEGKAVGTAVDELAASEAAFPRLEAAVSQLKKLGEVATYTLAGQARDFTKRNLGMDVGEGAVARAEYIAHVKNNVLPLLRQTFGAAFTAAEGESLLATLGDPDSAPEEKEAVLNAFITGKKADIETQRRRVNAQMPGQQPPPLAQGVPGTSVDGLPPPAAAIGQGGQGVPPAPPMALPPGWGIRQIQ